MKILVTTDLSSSADRAVLRAIKLANQHDASLIIAHVIDEEAPDQLIDESKKIARQELSQCIKGHVRDLEYRIEIIVGRPHSSILKLIESESVDLVVLGLHRHSERGEPMLGSVIERVIKSSVCPILVIKNRSEVDYKNILVAADFNVHSKRSIKLALKLFEDCEFHMVHAYHAPIVGTLGYSASSIDRQIKKSCEQDLREMVSSAIKDIDKKHRDHHNISSRVVSGNVFDVINQESAKINPELLVIGTHGRRGLSKIVSLNVAEHFLVNPSCDILIAM